MKKKVFPGNKLDLLTLLAVSLFFGAVYVVMMLSHLGVLKG